MLSCNIQAVHSWQQDHAQVHHAQWLTGGADLGRDIKQVMEGPPHKLLESVAEDIAAGILEEYALVSGVRILIKKPHVAVEGVVKYLGDLLPLAPLR